jgi:hypothetical protein
MNADTQTIRDDLAFLRALVQQGSDSAGAWSEGYFAGGLIYGGQMLLHAGQAVGLVSSAPPWGLMVGLGPTLVFLPTLVWISWRRRRDRPLAPVGRAVALVFGAVGLANLALIAVIGGVALREKSFVIWLIYPACVFILQGAAWMAAAALRRKTWMGIVAAAWFGFAIAMGMSVQHTGYYVLFAGLGIWSCMALPGWHMVRSADKPD